MDIYDFLFQNYITYDRLFALSSKALYGERVEKGEINLFMDLNSFTKRLWGSYNQFTFKSMNVLVASIINACGHYRQYFWTRHMCKTNIYLVWGWNTSPYQPYLNYNAHFVERVESFKQMGNSVCSLIEAMIEQLKFLCRYLPQVYFVDGGMNEVSVVIYDLVGEIGKGLPNIVLSKDVYSYQLVSCLPSTFVYRPKKVFNNGVIIDNSWVVTKTNLFKAFRYDMSYAISNAKNPIPDPHYANLGLVLGISGMRKRHVKGFRNFNDACRFLIKLLPEAGDMKCDIYQLDVAIKSNGVKSLTSYGDGGRSVIDIYNILSVEVNAAYLLNSPEWILMKEGLVDLYNPQGIMEIGDKEFVEYPLELGEL